MTHLVLTSNKYKHLVKDFKMLFDRYFGEANIKLVCFEIPEDCGFEPKDIISLGEGNLTWSKQLKEALETLDDEHVVVWHEDHWLLRPVKIKTLNLIESYMKAFPEIKRFSLQSVRDGYEGESKLHSDTIDGYKMYQLDEKAQYLFSVEVSIWRRDFLLHNIDPSENHWEIELNMSRRCWGEKVMVLEEPVTYYKDAVRGGGEKRLRWENGELLLLVPGDTWEKTGIYENRNDSQS